jgi:molybdopterin molybdotransferase
MGKANPPTSGKTAAPPASVPRLIGVAEAQARVLDGVTPLASEVAPLLDALGRVLADDIVADADIPPFRNSAMDGYAVRAADLPGARRTAPVRLRVVAEGPAGYAPRGTVTPGTAIRIMTGAPLPPGADTVVRFEDTGESDHINERRVAGPDPSVAIYVEQPAWVNVREAGEDIRCGALALRAGAVLHPPALGILAALGRLTVTVYGRPAVAILSTGDEVAHPDAPLLPGQIRDSNSYTLAALVLHYGGVPRLLGIARDSPADLTSALAAVSDADLVLTSGGVSVGDYDMVKDVLRAQGKINLWQVRMKPGRPLAFGQLGGKPFLGLPGNPVAAYVSFEIFVRPLLLRLQGHQEWRKAVIRARLTEDVENQSGRQHYVRAVVTQGAAGPLVQPAHEQGAGVLTSVLHANGLLIVPEGVTRLTAGTLVDVEPLHWLPGLLGLP